MISGSQKAAECNWVQADALQRHGLPGQIQDLRRTKEQRARVMPSAGGGLTSRAIVLECENLIRGQFNFVRNARAIVDGGDGRDAQVAARSCGRWVERSASRSPLGTDASPTITPDPTLEREHPRPDRAGQNPAVPNSASSAMATPIALALSVRAVEIIWSDEPASFFARVQASRPTRARRSGKL
jgi:hypothetical protein